MKEMTKCFIYMFISHVMCKKKKITCFFYMFNYMLERIGRDIGNYDHCIFILVLKHSNGSGLSLVMCW